MHSIDEDSEKDVVLVQRSSDVTVHLHLLEHLFSMQTAAGKQLSAIVHDRNSPKQAPTCEIFPAETHL